MKRLIPWLGAATIIVIIFGTIYTVVQQAQRMAANDPQIQLAEDTAASLNHGSSPAMVASGHVDMASSLAPFIVVYDKLERPVSGSGYRNGYLPNIPYGVLTAANGKDYHYVTWQPASNVRIAAVTVAADNYYVLSGRNMREVEKNEMRTLERTAIGCVASLAVLTAVWMLRPRSSK